MATFLQAQYDDLAAKENDLYAHTKYDILLAYLKGQPPLNILNAGCGSGDLSLRLAACGHRVHGIDPEAAYIDLALKRAAARPGASCTFQVSSIENYTADRAFDCVIATDVLEHIQDDRTAFTRLCGLVKPGGLVLITVPAGQWLFGYHDEQLGHFRRYNRAMLRALVGGECHVEAMRYFGFSLIPVCLMYSKWLRRPYPVAESGDKKKRPLGAWALKTLLKMDRTLPLPFGTSLLFKGVRKAA